MGRPPSTWSLGVFDLLSCRISKLRTASFAFVEPRNTVESIRTAKMSTTVSSAAASATCGSTLYNIPVDDAACAMPYSGNYTDIMEACCKSAAVISYYDNCGIYCLAIDQSISDLTDCMYKNGAPFGKYVNPRSLPALSICLQATLPRFPRYGTTPMKYDCF